jgi:chromosome segregation ATPase
LISENRELNKQLSEAEDEIALLKQQIEEMRCTVTRKDSELEMEFRRSQGLLNIKEQNIMLQLELREYRQERERMHQAMQDLTGEWERINAKMREENVRISQERNNLN